jgi:hypothetical protein
MNRATAPMFDELALFLATPVGGDAYGEPSKRQGTPTARVAFHTETLAQCCYRVVRTA